jgi:cytochrome c5
MGNNGQKYIPEVAMDHQEDRAFLRQFSGVIVGFMLLTVALIFLARYMQPDPTGDANPSQAILAEQRIQPVGAVLSGEEGTAALAEAQSAAAEAAPAQDIVVDGSAVYDGLCKTCHDAGVAGAPIAKSDQMAARLDEKGLETLVSNAINGLNAMPPRGGNPTLTDEQIQAAVEFMLP